MGANSALFTVVNALLLRPLPFPRSEELVEISIAGRSAKLEDLEGVRSIESAGAFEVRNLAVSGNDDVRMAYSFQVTPDLIPLLELQPALGRALTRADFLSHAVMLGYEYWASLGGRPDIIGQALTLDGEQYSIVGVLPADFFLSVRDVKLIVPSLRNGGGRTIGRLRPGVTPAQAQAEIDSLVPGGHSQVIPLARAFHGNDSRPIVLLLAMAGFVLLITCANLANLQLVRGLARRREFAIRTAIGASHGRLIGQLAGESAMLGVAGAALGLLLTRVLHDGILATLPANISRRLNGADALALDTRVLAFSFGVAVVTVLLFGLLPALSSVRFDVIAGLRSARGAGRERQRFGQSLVTIEIAIALMLLAGAGLTFKSLSRLESQYLGFHPQGVLRAMTDFSSSRYSSPELRVAVFAEAERRIREIPGVAGVGIVAPQAFPFGGRDVRGARFEISGEPAVEARAEVYYANPGYLDSIGLPLLRGRWFTDADTLEGQRVAVLSDVVARRYFGEGDCIGRRVRLSADHENSVWTTIVGVVGDVKNPTAEQWQPTAYVPFAQAPSNGATLMIRAAFGDPMSLAPSIRRELHAIDRTAPEFRIVAALDAAVLDYVSLQRFTTRLLGVFAAVGLALAFAGVYGVTRFWVASRTGEIGIRLALGAQRSNVLRLVLGRAGITAAWGVAGGILGAVALRRVMASQLVGVSAVDPVVLGLVSAAIFGVAVAAAWAPARRASRIDPAEALRAE